jgi:hypothetical protein
MSPDNKVHENMLHVSIDNILSFYDFDTTARPHSAAVKLFAGEELGLALLLNYFQGTGRKASKLEGIPATKGYRLDGWIKLENQQPILYQVEVKSWSMHGFGSGNQALALDISAEEFKQYRKKVWSTYWNDSEFTSKSHGKVIEVMNNNPDTSLAVEPLLCLWSSVHPDGENTEFFQVKLNNSHKFPHFNVFSMSTYLRRLRSKGQSNVKLHMPKATERLRRINQIYSF